MNKLNKYKIDQHHWKRQDHYNFFNSFEQPYFGITCKINCTAAYQYCKAYKTPFFLYYLYQSLMAANQAREFRYRIEKEEVFEYTQISGSITVLRNNETFGFAYFEFYPDFKTFAEKTKTAIHTEKAGTGLKIRADLTNLIHYSVLPEIDFSSMQHAQLFTAKDSIPKIVFGKITFEHGQVFLPLSVHVNHALCDGLHVSNYIGQLTRKLQII